VVLISQDKYKYNTIMMFAKVANKKLMFVISETVVHEVDIFVRFEV